MAAQLMDVLWLKIRSWHIASGLLNRVSATETTLRQTLCGRWVDTNPVSDRPANERTCESCLRIQVGR